jgi:hypothetical protein
VLRFITTFIMKHLSEKVASPVAQPEYFGSVIRCLFSLGVVLGIFSTGVCLTAAGASLIPGEPTDLFYSIGIDAGGTVVIPGRHGSVEGFFESLDGNLIFRQLPVDGIIVEHGVVGSRDGHYLAAKLASGPPALLVRPTLSVRMLPDDGWDVLDWITTLDGEPVVGGSVLSGFVSEPATWSQSHGFRDLSTLWGAGAVLTSISSDGQIVGTGSRLGEPVILYGSQTNCLVLHGEGNDNFDVTAFSSNGRFITADFGRTIFSQAVLWTNMTPTLLAQPDDEPARATSAVSDSGFIAGQGRYISGVNPRADSAFLFDPTIGLSKWFDDWWSARPSAPPLKSAITNINDLYEVNGNLYCLLETVDQGPILAIARLEGIQPPVLQISRVSAGDVQLRWSSSQPSFIEASASLPADWKQLPNLPIVSGEDYSLDLPASDRTRFFRVRTQ